MYTYELYTYLFGKWNSSIDEMLKSEIIFVFSFS